MVVVDSSVLILLCRIGKLPLLEKYFKKVMITQDIYDEIKSGIGSNEIEKARRQWIKIENPKGSGESYNLSKLENLERADASIIILSEEKKEILLSNDYALIMTARTKGIECWWLTTFILRCLRKRLLKKDEAKQILFELIEAGMRLSNDVYAAVLKEIDNFYLR